MERHGRLVLSIARRVTGHASDADDVAQESFLRVYRSLRRVDPSRPLEPWLVRITLNVARSFMERRRSSPALDARDVEDALEAAPEAEGRAEAEDVRRALGEALRSLPEKERLAFELRELEGMETASVAESLDVSPITIRRQVMGARTKLVAWFRRHRPELVPEVARERGTGSSATGSSADSEERVSVREKNGGGDERGGGGPGKKG